MSQFLQASNSIKLTKNINLSAATVSGVSIEMGAHNEGHITTVKGAQYALTDATTGRILYPRRIVRVKKNLDITLLDGTKVQLVVDSLTKMSQTSRLILSHLIVDVFTKLWISLLILLFPLLLSIVLFYLA